MANSWSGRRHSTARRELARLVTTCALGLSGVALSGCADSALAPPEARCAEGNRPGCVDLPPVARLHYQVGAPTDEGDYPFGLEARPPSPIAPQAIVFLSAHGSADPEAEPTT